MIEQQGFLRLVKGSLGKTTFVKSKDGYRAQEKMVVSTGRFKNDPKFARVRENAADFGHAATDGKVLRKALNSLLESSTDSKLPSRLVKRILQIIKADHNSVRGQGNIIDGPTELLEGFEFNAESSFSQVFKPAVISTINRVTGELTVHMDAFVPIRALLAPKGATHFQFVTAGCEIDFAQQKFVTDAKQTAPLPLDINPTNVISVVHTVTANSTLPLVLVVGVRFTIQQGSKSYPLSQSDSNPLTILKVNKA